MAQMDPDGKREDEQGGSDIKVTDRRLFTLDGTLRKELQDEEEKPEDVPGPTRPASAPAVGREAGFEHRPVSEPEGVDFTMLLNAMAQPALLFLGEIPHPQTNAAEVDLEQARLQIGMLELLKVKCRGNLSRDEDGLLDRILYQLRMLYVARSSGRTPA